MSSISAGTSTGSALVSTGDTSGALQLQVNGTTPSVTLAANGSIGVGSTPAYGTSGQVLTSAGTGAAPTWVTASAGAMTFISVQTVSGTPSTLDFTSGISSTYDDYIVIFENVALSANAAKLQMLLYKSGAFQVDTYSEVFIYADASGAAPVGVGDSATFTISRQSSSTNTNLRSGTINLYNLNSTTAYASSCTWSSQNTGASGTGTNNVFTTGGGTEATAAVVTQLRFRPNTGTFTSGKFRLYGIQKS
jgi:hypothetical protein